MCYYVLLLYAELNLEHMLSLCRIIRTDTRRANPGGGNQSQPEPSRNTASGHILSPEQIHDFFHLCKHATHLPPPRNPARAD